MDYTPCHLVVQKHWSKYLHPLHLLTDRVRWTTRFGECASPLIVSLVETSRSAHAQCLFAVLHLDNCPLATDEVKQSLASFCDQDNVLDKCFPIGFVCSSEFIQHYKLNALKHDLLFACGNTFSLDRVVIAAKTTEAFQWAKQQGFETGLLVASTCNRSLLIRCNDRFLSPPLPGYGDNPQHVLKMFNELFVVSCSPVQQGTLSINTSVIIVNTQDIDLALPDASDVDEVVNNQEFSVTICDSLILTMYSNHTSTHCNNQQSKLSTLFCCESTGKQLAIEDGDYIAGTLHFQNKEENSQSTISRTFVLQLLPDELFCSHVSGEFKGNVSRTLHSHYLQMMMLSSTCWFNTLGHERTLYIQPSKCTIRVEKLQSSQLIHSRHIHLSLILSPNYPPSLCFDKSLVRLFSQSQIVKVGDVISIHIEDDDDEFMKEVDPRYYSCKVIYYKVMNLGEDANEDDCYLADVKHTSVYQDGTTNSFTPSLMFNQVHNVSAPRWEVAGLTKYIRNLRNIISPHLLQTGHFDYPCTVLLSGQPGCGKSSIVSSVCAACNLHLVVIDCNTLSSDTPGASEAKIKDAFRRGSTNAPCVIMLSGVDTFGSNKDTNRPDDRVVAAFRNTIQTLPHCSATTVPVVVIATTNDKDAVISDIRTSFLHQVNVESPDENDRLLMMLLTSQSLSMSRDVDYQWLAKHTAGFVFGDFWELMRRSMQEAYTRIIEKCSVGSKLSWYDEESLSMAGVTSSNNDVIEALQQMQSDRADTIGVPKIPTVDWKDIGGLEDVKSHILDTIQLPLDHPELVSTGLRRSGVLLYGPPGTGKTLLAKAVASQCSLSFLSVKGPELINMYVGQSEANVRRVFQRARDAAPCVVFFDELDALAPNRGKSGDSGGVMDRVVSQLLAELDGVNSSDDADKQVFIIAASNRPDLIDQALLRPGRLDKLLYVGINESNVDKIKVLQAQTRKLYLSPEVNFDEVVDLCPPNMTGADFKGLTSEAAISSVRRRIVQLEAGEHVTGSCMIEQLDLIEAAKNVVPSVTDEQLRNYKRVKSNMTR